MNLLKRIRNYRITLTATFLLSFAGGALSQEDTKNHIRIDSSIISRILSNPQHLSEVIFDEYNKNKAQFLSYKINNSFLNLTRVSYDLEKKYPGFCGFMDGNKRQKFLEGPNYIHFRRGGFLDYVERNCNARIFYNLNINKLIILIKFHNDTSNSRAYRKDELVLITVNSFSDIYLHLEKLMNDTSK